MAIFFTDFDQTLSYLTVDFAQAFGSLIRTTNLLDWFGRFKRRSIIISRAKDMVDLTMALFARCRVNGRIAELFTLAMIT
jgi:hypothetical protein